MTTTFTRYFRWGIPGFTTSPWHADWAALVNAIDRTLYDAMIAVGMEDWANSTAYQPGDIVLDTTDGSIWICEVAHTSVVSPTTFAANRAANPTYWSGIAPLAEIESLVGQAQGAAAQSSGAAASAMMAAQQASMLLTKIQAMLSANQGMMMALTGEADRNARDARAVLSQVNAQNAVIAAYAAMASQSATRAAASAASLTDDQITLKAAFFN